MALKLILSICVLLHLKGHVASSSLDVEDYCIGIVKKYPEEAKGFAEEDATQEDLEGAIESITPMWNSDENSTEQDWADVKAEVTVELTQCFDIRKVKYF